MTQLANPLLKLDKRKISRFLVGALTLLAGWVGAASNVSLVWDPSADPSVAGYKIYYGQVSHNYTASVDVGNVTSSAVAVPADNATYYFAATTYDVSGVESDFSNEATYSVAPVIIYQPPTLAAINNLAINENAGLQTVGLSGIRLGSGAALTITATSSNPALIPNPTVSYTNPNAAGSLSFTPVKDQFGSATITVTANNGESQSNLVSRTFTVTVAAVYLPPTLAVINNLSLNENAGLQTVGMAGIGLGSGLAVTITASSSNPSLIPNPTVSYTSPNAAGSLSLTPAKDQFGSATITVTANNGESQSNLVSRTFTVTVAAVYLPPTLAVINNLSLNENAGLQTVGMSGIGLGSGSAVTITATSSNPSLIPNPTVNYTSPNTAGSLSLTPAKDQFGSATITVTANNGESQSNLVSRTFTVTVAAVYLPPTLAVINNLSLNENAGLQTVGMAGIGLGSGLAVTITASSSNPSLIPNPTVSYTSPNAAGSLSLTPAKDQFGSATITVTANNGESQSNLVSRTFTVTVAAVYLPPTLAVINNLSLNENAGLQTVGMAGIGLGSGTAVTITATSSNPALIPTPTVNYTSPNAAGSLSFTPVKDQFGSATITVTANNGESQSNLVSRTFTVTVAAVYLPPTLAAINNLSLNENAGLQTVGMAGIGLGSGSALTITASSSNPSLIPNPTVSYTSPNAAGSLSFTPVKDQFGSATITVTANNGESQSNLVSRTFTVTVAAVYLPPTLAVINNLSLNENAGLQTVGMSGIGLGSGSAVTITASSSNPSLIPNPTVNYTSPNAAGSLSFTPVKDQFGSATITVTANNGESQSNLVSRTFMVTVAAVYLPPTLATLNNLSINKNAGLQTVNLAGIGLGSGTALTITATSSNPSLIPNPTVNYTSPNAAGSLAFTPVVEQFGSAIITVTANNGESQSNLVSRTFMVTVAAVYLPPTLATINNLSLNENAGPQTVNLAGIGLGSGFALSIIAQSSNPSLIPNPLVNYISPDTAGSLTFTPVKNQRGTATITVIANNGQAQSNLVACTFTVTVAAVYLPPTLATINNLSINENAGLQTVGMSGIGLGSGSAVTITASSSNPSLIPNPTVNYTSPNAAGSLSFTPAKDQFGSATITVTANNGESQSNLVSRTFTVTVAAVYLPPTLAAINNLSLNENAGLQTVNLAGIGLGSGSVVTITATSSNPSLIPNPTVNYTSPNAAGSLSFTPVKDQFGSATITVTANNGESQSNLVSRTFTVTVAAVYLAPTLATLNNLSLNENAGPQTVNLAGIGLGSGFALSIIAQSSNPSLIPNPLVNYISPDTAGSLTFTPVKNQRGTATITVIANNGQAQSNLVACTFTVTVAAVYLPPTLATINNLSLNENTGLQTVGLAGIGLGSGSAVTLTATSSNPLLIPPPTIDYTSPNPTGALTFSPVKNQFGTATITVTANNGEAQSNLITRTFTVAVADLPNAPEIQPQSITPTLNPLADLSLSYNAAAQTVALSGIGPGASGALPTLVLAAVSNNPKVVPNPTVSYTNGQSTGSLILNPIANTNGMALVTVTVNDGGPSNNIITRTFSVTVAPNQKPTLDAITNRTLGFNSGVQKVALTGIGPGAAGELQTLKITAVSSNTKLVPNPTVSYTNGQSTGHLTIKPVTGKTGTAKITVTINDGIKSSSLIQMFTVTVLPNQKPTLNVLTNLTLAYNAAAQKVALTGIGPGAAGEIQTLKITAVSSNTKLVPNPTVSYTNGQTAGNLTIKPVAGSTGSAKITVTINDGIKSSSLVRTFAVTVAPNQKPTLDALANLTLAYNAAAQKVVLTGIGPGASGEVQTLLFTAISSNPKIVPNPMVSYTNGQNTGCLTINPSANTNGSALITVMINDGAKSSNLVTRTFSVMVVAPAMAPVAVPVAVPVAASAQFSVSSTVAATLTAVPSVNGQFTFNVAGVTGYQYAVEVSADLTQWTPVQTNTAPFQFTDGDSGQHAQRFYRTVYVP